MPHFSCVHAAAKDALSGFKARERIARSQQQSKTRYTVEITLPADMTYDTALMFRRFERDGYQGAPGAAGRFAGRLGRPLRTYRTFAEELRDAWLTPRARPTDAETQAHP